MWTYSQSTGRLLRSGQYIATGYSGAPEARNDPKREREPNVGPIPRGVYRIGEPVNTEHCGSYCLPLEPVAKTNTHGRGGFLIHGDNKKAPGTASKGCLVFPRCFREAIHQSGDTLLEVV